MKVYIFSDSHGFHDNLIIPECDMIIFAGDESNSRKTNANIPEAVSFLVWLEKLDIEHKVMIAGNHSTAIYNKAVDPSAYNITYLEHETKEVGGLSIFGSPKTPNFMEWSFMYPRAKGNKVWESIPDSADIVLTHGPPYGKLDTCYDGPPTSKIKHAGCKNLLTKIQEVRPVLSIFGHIHDEKEYQNYGILQQHGIKFINAAVFSHRHPTWLNAGHLIEL